MAPGLRSRERGACDMKRASTKPATTPRDLRHRDFLRAVAAMIADAMITNSVTGREASQARSAELANPRDVVKTVAPQDEPGRGTRTVTS